MVAVRQGTEPLSALAMLNEPLRRRAYELIAGRGEVSRDGVASALGVARTVAAFHLDKLVAAGLLDVAYRRPPGRAGPGAGRPAKWYRRAAGEIAVSVPERRYDLAAEILAGAVERASEAGAHVEGVLAEVARAHGHDVGGELRPTSSDAAAGPGTSLAERLVDVLSRHGYEPELAGGVITMVNCPFHALAEQHRDLVCRMNHQLLSGVVEEARLDPAAARLDPGPGRCCVTIVT